MLEALADDVDIVVTTWNPDETEVRERLSSRIFHRMFARIIGVQLPRNLGTYRLFTREFRAAVLDYPESTAVYGPLMAQMGFNASYVEVKRSAPTGREVELQLPQARPARDEHVAHLLRRALPRPCRGRESRSSSRAWRTSC